jgi:4-amino-4-deoxy-L-arabinose transferase-like glycosyltransferase
LLSSLLLGLAQAALQPPWEGFDEPHHYAYISQVAATGRWAGKDAKIPREFDAYLKVAPMTGSMPGPLSYDRFFTASSSVIAAGHEAIHTAPHEPRTYVPGEVGNWQGQHPPLYYYALAPVFLATKHMSLAGQLFVLRAASYLLAWAGLCIVAAAALRGTAGQRAAPVLLAICAWPLTFPMWFPEMSRIGNDSLVTLFAACVFILLWRVTAATRWRDYALLGLALGLALLTKATFLPATAAVLLVLGLRALCAYRERDELLRRIAWLCVTVLIMVAVCGWWYGMKLVETGSLIGSNDVARMHSSGGLIAGLEKNARAEDFLMMPIQFVLTFLWAGTWSFVVPPRTTYLPFVALSAILAYGIWRALRRRGIHPVESIALVAFALFVAGVTQHSLVSLSTASGAAPTWYLHSYAPLLALLVGVGLFEPTRSRWLKGALAALMLYPLLFLPAVTAMGLLFFAGCAPKAPGRMYVAWPNAVQCIADYGRMYDQLSVLAFPGIGIALFVAGWIIAAVAMVALVRLLYTSITSTR